VLGVNRDPVFGPVVMFGLGGIFVEALRDVTFRVAPIDHAEAMRMIREIKAFAVLEAYAAGPAAISTRSPTRWCGCLCSRWRTGTN